MEIIFGVFGIGFIIFSGAMLYLSHYAVRPRVHTLEYELEYLDGIPFMQGESIGFDEEYSISMADGTRLWAGLLRAGQESKHYVILSHGYTSTRYGMYKYAVLWKKLGYNCVLYDNRGHGANERSTISFGLRESGDLMEVIADTYARYGADIALGLHGESMGAGLQLMALSYGPRVDFIVNDCGYAEILPVLRWKVKAGFGLPGWLADLAVPYCKLCYGVDFRAVRPVDRLKENEIPICFVHGTADGFTHHWHSEKMYEANKGYKELHLYEGVDHASCVVADPERYHRMLQSFVSKVYN